MGEERSERERERRRGRLVLFISSQSRCLCCEKGIYGPGAYVPEEAHADEDVVRKFYFCIDGAARPSGGNVGPGGGGGGGGRSGGCAPFARVSAARRAEGTVRSAGSRDGSSSGSFLTNHRQASAGKGSLSAKVCLKSQCSCFFSCFFLQQPQI